MPATEHSIDNLTAILLRTPLTNSEQWYWEFYHVISHTLVWKCQFIPLVQPVSGHVLRYIGSQLFDMMLQKQLWGILFQRISNQCVDVREVDITTCNELLLLLKNNWSQTYHVGINQSLTKGINLCQDLGWALQEDHLDPRSFLAETSSLHRWLSTRCKKH